MGLALNTVKTREIEARLTFAFGWDTGEYFSTLKGNATVVGMFAAPQRLDVICGAITTAYPKVQLWPNDETGDTPGTGQARWYGFLQKLKKHVDAHGNTGVAHDKICSVIHDTLTGYIGMVFQHVHSANPDPYVETANFPLQDANGNPTGQVIKSLVLFTPDVSALLPRLRISAKSVKTSKKKATKAKKKAAKAKKKGAKKKAPRRR